MVDSLPEVPDRTLLRRWSHLHLQPPLWTAIPEDHPYECLGRSEASWTVGEVEDRRGSCRARPVPTGRRTAETGHRHPEGHVGPARGPLARLPQHRHQRKRASVAVPGVHEDGEVRRFDLGKFRRQGHLG